MAFIPMHKGYELSALILSQFFTYLPYLKNPCLSSILFSIRYAVGTDIQAIILFSFQCGVGRKFGINLFVP
jgi:hypothetical protein